MAFPVVADTATSLEDGGNVTSHTVSLPPNIVDGDLLIVCFSEDSSPVITFPNEGTDWKVIVDLGGGGATRIKVAYRDADGSEGATITVTTATAERSAHCAYRITGHDTTRAPDEDGANNLGADANPNPNNNDQGGSAEDYLWIAIQGNDRDRTLDSYPTNYTANQLDSRGTGANSAGVGAATRDLNASAEDVGDFTLSASDQWTASTVAVHPAAPAEDNIIRPMPQLLPLPAPRAAPDARWIDNLLAVPERLFPPIRPMPQLLPLPAARAGPNARWIDNLLAVPELEVPPIRPMVQLHPRAAPRDAPAAYQIQNTFGLVEPDNLIRPMLQLHPRAAARAAPIAYQIQNHFGLVEPENLIRPMDFIPVRVPARAAPFNYWIQNLVAVAEAELPPGVQVQVTVYRSRRAAPSAYWIQGLIAAQIQPPPVTGFRARRNQADIMQISVFI